MHLYIANKLHSSWSLRPWLLMTAKGIPFEEHLIPMYLPDSKARMLAKGPTGKCPVLIDGDRIDLEIAKDHQSDFFQWFSFRVAGAHGRRLTFRILNAGESAYPFGWPGYKTRASTDRIHWRMIDTTYDNGVLSFDYTVEGQLAWFAYFAPYTMEMHHDLVARTAAKPSRRHRARSRRVIW